MQRPAKPFTPVRFRIQPPLVMKIGIIGYGFVGKALFSAFNNNVEVFKVDPKVNTDIKDLKKFAPDAVFICLPTPMRNDGSIDSSIIISVLNDIKSCDFNCLIVIKSTIHPGIIKKLEDIIGDFVYNPEFLREKYSESDFVNSKLIVFGGNKNFSKKVAAIYKNFTKCICTDYVYTDTISASLLKYTINSFLATKVIFFNELKELFDTSSAEESWENFIKMLSLDIRIGSSHMNVPGPDGRFGFGGACFPKDTNAIVDYANNLGVDMKLIKKVIDTNNKIRAEYNTKIEREVDQNIQYKK